MAILGKLSNYKSTGLLLMRLGLGAMMILHGYPKLLGGPDRWTKLGSNTRHFGVNDYPEIFGFMAAFSETVGGLFLILGLLFRPSCFLLLITMIVATASHFAKGDGIMGASHAIELCFVFLGLFIIGPGKYSVDKN